MDSLQAAPRIQTALLQQPAAITANPLPSLLKRRLTSSSSYRMATAEKKMPPCKPLGRVIEHGKDFNESMDFMKQQAEARNLVFFFVRFDHRGSRDLYG